ncbi:ADP-ribosylglycohydrolase family protein [Lignipirellula cremea]|uniref:ADP-ribosyl-[dinitrogen reductase] glycohydrolase n=1 Tax=Lignipirellula cremea TaxID=2528010 RepID=A0A518DXP8_9BACT|nr:ADP-ribosylglycohydrolase family protein [Lignipirellula cremea]QDU96612.1 ADP-ribosyl-[dinitrogen reductase] glycohydrolase [Lignipirellula cremea]
MELKPQDVAGDRAQDAIVGALLGMAVGDALGLPYEGLSRRRGGRLLGEPDRFRFLSGRGMISDDTEHACMVAQALIASGDDVDLFSRELAGLLRGWLLGLPAGTGLATLKAAAKLCAGVSPDRSGLFSAGNGPAMRSPMLGAAVTDRDLLRRLVKASTRITHTDPKAEYGSWAIALASRLASGGTVVEPAAFRLELANSLAGEPAEELLQRVDRARESSSQGQTTLAFADSLGLQHGVSGYINNTVPVVLHAWFRHPRDLPAAVQAVIRCGGDADTTAAIVGGVVGCGVGKNGVPAAWRQGLWEWPRTIAWMTQLAETLADCRARRQTQIPPRLPLYRLLPRNLLFLGIVLGWGFRRLLPPY